MFSGIIEKIDKATSIIKKNSECTITFRVSKSWSIHEGTSINIDGVCSTVTSVRNNLFSVYYMPETMRKTSFPYLRVDHFFNLELPLTMKQLLSGHLVTGHIDGVATIKDMTHEGRAKNVKITPERKLLRYIIYKGSVSINGVSLTVASVGKDFFSVSLIPYTLTHTNLGMLRKGEKVNIEVDILAKYLENFLRVLKVKQGTSRENRYKVES